MRRKLKNALVLLLLCCFVSALAAGCGQSPAASNDPPPASDPGQSSDGSTAGSDRTEKLTLRWGFTGTGSENDCQGYTVRYIADYVSEKTGGMITIDLFPGAQLGAEGDMLDQVMTGNLDLCLASANTLTTIWPEFSFVTLPFAFPDLPTYWATVKADGIYDYLRDLTIDVGRPGVGARMYDVEKIAMACAQNGVKLEGKECTPLAALMPDLSTGKLEEGVLNERLLSVIVEGNCAEEDLPQVLAALKKVAGEIETVFSLGLIMRIDENGYNPALRCLDDLGIPQPHRAKINVGLGKPLID